MFSFCHENSIFSRLIFAADNFLSRCSSTSTCSRFGDPASAPLSHTNEASRPSPAVVTGASGLNTFLGFLPCHSFSPPPSSAFPVFYFKTFHLFLLPSENWHGRGTTRKEKNKTTTLPWVIAACLPWPPQWGSRRRRGR